MIEALLFLSTLLVVTCLCWLIWKADRAKTDKPRSLWLFAYKDDNKS